MYAYEIKAKLLGRPICYAVETDYTRITVRYKTIIYRNDGDYTFLYKLMELGFLIESCTRKYLEVILPEGWKHFRISKEIELIVDKYGRNRLEINRKNKTSKLLRRFDYILNYFSTEKEGKKEEQLVAQITDAGRVIRTLHIDQFSFVGLKKEMMSEEAIIEHVNKAMEQIMNGSFPGWQDELAYWD
jgi:hypothetical protein